MQVEAMFVLIIDHGTDDEETFTETEPHIKYTIISQLEYLPEFVEEEELR